MQEQRLVVHPVYISGNVQVARPSAAYDLSFSIDFYSNCVNAEAENGCLKTLIGVGWEPMISIGSKGIRGSAFSRLYTSFSIQAVE